MPIDHWQAGESPILFLQIPYPINLLVSKRGFTQTDSGSLTRQDSQIGLGVRVNFAANEQVCVYNNSRGEKVSMIHAFNDEIDYGTDLVFDLDTKKRK